MNLVRVNTQLLNQHERRRCHGTRQVAYCSDLLRSQAHWRCTNPASAHMAQQYQAAREISARPVLGHLRMIEAAIRCDVACRDAVQAFRSALR